MFKQAMASLIFFVFSANVGAATVHTTDFIDNNLRSNFNSFEDLPYYFGGDTHSFDGIVVQQINPGLSGISSRYDPGGIDGVRSWYANGGDWGYTSITLESGLDFENVGFLAGSGAGSFYTTVEIIFELWDDGVLVQSGRHQKTKPFSYLGFSGGGFDTIFILASTSLSAQQNIGDGVYNSLALDAIEVSNVPLPAGAWLFGSALVGLASLRRKK